MSAKAIGPAFLGLSAVPSWAPESRELSTDSFRNELVDNLFGNYFFEPGRPGILAGAAKNSRPPTPKKMPIGMNSAGKAAPIDNRLSPP
jgi:hypothetical protein